MTSSYKKLGPYIREVSIKNREGDVEKLLGVSITKKFIPSIANTVGTDMSKYKIVRTGQFAYGPVTSRNGDKISVALLEESDCILSTSYTVFEVIDTEELDPEYLMMWFRRPEFDRYARYMSHGSVREIFGWEEMCGVELPIPYIDVQREIVREYNVIIDRIKLNEQLCTKLEETAQALYKHWFVDFEFPISADYAASIGKPELEGKPYRSSGGKMRYNEELDAEIPEIWTDATIGELAKISAGGDRPKSFSEKRSDKFSVPIYSNSTDNEGLYGFTDKAKITDESLTVSARGAIIGYTVMRLEPFVPIVRLIVVTPSVSHIFNFMFQAIKNFRFDSGASAQGQLTVPDFSTFKILEPDEDTLKLYQALTGRIYGQKKKKEDQSKALKKMLKILSAKMSTGLLADGEAA